MKQFQVAFLAVAFVVAIAASAFKLPAGKSKVRSGERYFAYVMGNESTPGSYVDLGVSINPENEGCTPVNELCIIRIESTGTGSTSDPFLPEQNALNSLQTHIQNAKTAQANDATNGVYLKGE